MDLFSYKDTISFLIKSFLTKFYNASYWDFVLRYYVCPVFAN